MAFIKKPLLAYSLFDFANSSVSLIIHAYAFPLFVKNVLFANDPRADLIWGFSFSLSVLLAALMAPFVGRHIDSRWRWGGFRIAALLSFATLGALAVAIGSPPSWVLATFVLANVFFYIAANLYDSLLTEVSALADRARFSGFAWGFGYLGGLACLGLIYAARPDLSIASYVPYIITALFYTVFGLLSVSLLRKVTLEARPRTQVSFREMLRALDTDRRVLLVGYWLVSDAITAVVIFVSIFGSHQLHLTARQIGFYLVVIQVIAIPGTYLVSRLAATFGMRRIILGCLAAWIAILVGMILARNVEVFAIIAVATAFVIGSTQALMRAQYSTYSAVSRSSELFGWYAFATESAAVISPALFGIVSLLWGERAAMASLALPLIAGGILIQRGASILDARVSRSEVSG